MILYRIVLANGSRLFVEGDMTALEGGTLQILNKREELIAAFAQGVWACFYVVTMADKGPPLLTLRPAGG